MKAIAVVSFRQREPKKSDQKSLRQSRKLAAPAHIRRSHLDVAILDLVYRESAGP